MLLLRQFLAIDKSQNNHSFLFLSHFAFHTSSPQPHFAVADLGGGPWVQRNPVLQGYSVIHRSRAHGLAGQQMITCFYDLPTFSCFSSEGVIDMWHTAQARRKQI